MPGYVSCVFAGSFSLRGHTLCPTLHVGAPAVHRATVFETTDRAVRCEEGFFFWGRRVRRIRIQPPGRTFPCWPEGKAIVLPGKFFLIEVPVPIPGKESLPLSGPAASAARKNRYLKVTSPSFHAIGIHFLPERFPADIQHLGRPGLVALRHSEHLQYVLPLGIDRYLREREAGGESLLVLLQHV